MYLVPLPGDGEGARDRYRPYHEKARRQIERELALIGKLELAGYFLIVWDIVNFCRREGILVQGRGSAANSAVCYSLGITAVDPVGMELLFERFLSEERGEWPDIDLDLPSGDRREQVIQHVYAALRRARRGHDRQRHHLSRAQRRPRDRQGAGHPDGRTSTGWPRFLRPFEYVRPARHARAPAGGGRLRPPTTARIAALRAALRGDPGPAAPPRPALGRDGRSRRARSTTSCRWSPRRMPGRVVVQWDKDDCADLGIVKVDLLGLGMMAALQDSLAHPGAARRTRSTSRTCPRTTRRSTRCCRPPTPSASSRWRAARRWPPCRA